MSYKAPPVPSSFVVRPMAPPAAQGYQGPSATYASRPAAPAAPQRVYGATSYTARPAAPAPAQEAAQRPTSYVARSTASEPAQEAYRPAARRRLEIPERSESRRPRRAPVSGLGQAAEVSSRWKYAAIGLAALVVAQFAWWNAKAPQVLRLGGY